MKKLLVPTLTLFLGSLLAAQAQFTPGNLAVLQLGTGLGALSSAGTPVFIDQFNISTANQTVNQFVTIPTDGTGLVLSGTATSEGALTLSSDGSILTFGGYSAAAGTATIASSTAPRQAGTANAGGLFSIAANTSSSMSGNNIRTVVSDGQNNWLAGPGGVFYQASGSLSLTAITTSSNVRTENIFNGSLYFSIGSGATRGIFAFAGTPSSASSGSIFINTGATSSPYDFALNAAGTIAYVADDRSAASGGGIQKWVFDGTSWSLSYTLALGAAAAGGARQLTVDWSAANPIIYATTTEASANRLVDIADTGAGAAFTTLATAGVNTVFRGVDFTPTPEPSTLALGGLGLATLAWFRRNRKA